MVAWMCSRLTGQVPVNGQNGVVGSERRGSGRVGYTEAKLEGTVQKRGWVRSRATMYSKRTSGPFAGEKGIFPIVIAKQRVGGEFHKFPEFFSFFSLI